MYESNSLCFDGSESKGAIIRKWVHHRMSGKICFMSSVFYMLLTYLFLNTFPNIVLFMYCITFPILFILRIYFYIKSKDFLFLFDNCYFLNTALIIYLCIGNTVKSVFLPIFSIANGPVLWAVLPFRNTLAYHDLDKITSCFIHWAPPIITWSVRWFPQNNTFWWFKSFESHKIEFHSIYNWQATESWIWLIAVPFLFLVVHDVVYGVIVHGLIKPAECYSDSFTYQRTRPNLIGQAIRKMPANFQHVFYSVTTFTVYLVAMSVSYVSYHVFLVHTGLLVLQIAILVWNGACYYLDYFAYLALKARTDELDTDRSVMVATKI